MLPGGAFQLIDDSYNANPASVRAALEVLGGVTIAKGGRRIAVLGDMLELGNHSRSLHEHLAAPAAESAELVFTCGPEMKHLYDALPKERRGGHGEDSNAAADMPQLSTTPKISPMRSPPRRPPAIWLFVLAPGTSPPGRTLCRNSSSRPWPPQRTARQGAVGDADEKTR